MADASSGGATASRAGSPRRERSSHGRRGTDDARATKGRGAGARVSRRRTSSKPGGSQRSSRPAGARPSSGRRRARGRSASSNGVTADRLGGLDAVRKRLAETASGAARIAGGTKVPLLAGGAALMGAAGLAGG